MTVGRLLRLLEEAGQEPDYEAVLDALDQEAVVLPEEAAIFTDGRYTIQVRQQVSPTEWSYQSVPETSVSKWLKDNAPDGARIGYDPWLHTAEWVKQATTQLASKGAELVAVGRNPIDSSRSINHIGLSAIFTPEMRTAV